MDERGLLSSSFPVLIYISFQSLTSYVSPVLLYGRSHFFNSSWEISSLFLCGNKHCGNNTGLRIRAVIDFWLSKLLCYLGRQKVTSLNFRVFFPKWGYNTYRGGITFASCSVINGSYSYVYHLLNINLEHLEFHSFKHSLIKVAYRSLCSVPMSGCCYHIPYPHSPMMYKLSPPVDYYELISRNAQC